MPACLSYAALLPHIETKFEGTSTYGTDFQVMSFGWHRHDGREATALV